MDASYSEHVRRLINADPCIKECLARGLVNYSELSRRLATLIAQDTGVPPNPGTLKVAVLRYAQKLKSTGTRGPTRRLMSVLARSSLELRTGVTVATVRLHALPQLAKAAGELLGKARLLLVMQSLTSITVTISSEYFPQLEDMIGRESFIEVYPDQAVLIIVSPDDVIRVPGFVSYVTSILAENNINISQIESVYTDTLLIMKLDDALKAFHMLREAIEVARRSIEEAGQNPS